MTSAGDSNAKSPDRYLNYVVFVTDCYYSLWI
jgi:hypothetical protein